MGGQTKLPKLRTDTKKPMIKSSVMWFNGISLFIILYMGLFGDIIKIWVNDPMLIEKIQKTILLVTGVINASTNLFLRYFLTSQRLKFN